MDLYQQKLKMALIVLLSSLVLFNSNIKSVDAFTGPARSSFHMVPTFHGPSEGKMACRINENKNRAFLNEVVAIYSSNESETDGEVTATSMATEASKDSIPTSDVPINLPSPILLSSSMILAIASTGSVFELAGGNGSIPTIAITVAGIPLCFFLFYAAIKKGIAETEADDAEFQRRTNRY